MPFNETRDYHPEAWQRQRELNNNMNRLPKITLPTKRHIFSKSSPTTSKRYNASANAGKGNTSAKTSRSHRRNSADAKNNSAEDEPQPRGTQTCADTHSEREDPIIHASGNTQGYERGQTSTSQRNGAGNSSETEIAHIDQDTAHRPNDLPNERSTDRNKKCTRPTTTLPSTDKESPVE